MKLLVSPPQKKGGMSGEVAQQVKMIVAKPENLSFILRVHTVEGQNKILCCPLTSTSTAWHIPTVIYTYI